MAVNLSRNTRVFLTTNSTYVSATPSTSLSAVNLAIGTDTWEIPVLAGYSLSQNTENQTIQLNEAGATPNRGQRAFNTKLNPANWSFSTYVRPYKSTNVLAIESKLWEAISSPRFGTGATVTATAVSVSGSNLVFTTASTTGVSVGDAIYVNSITGGTYTNTVGKFETVVAVSNNASVTTTNTYAGSGSGTAATLTVGSFVSTTNSGNLTFMASNSHQLASFALVFLTDNSYFVVPSAVVNQAEISFDIGGISTIKWDGFGQYLFDATSTVSATTKTNLTAAPIAAISTAKYIANKLSTLALNGNGTVGSAGTTYSIPITGGSITINNNVTYLTPDNLGQVNTPVTYFTGTRAISGSLTAYLKTGTNESGQLLNDIIALSASNTSPAYAVTLALGGASNAVRVELAMPAATLQIPTVDVQDVVSTSIAFTAQATSAAGNAYDITESNELSIKYYSN